MKTTVELSDALLAEAKEIAAREGITLRTLIERPDAGAIIQRSGGVRKVRWAAGGKGKSGGVRIIYYWLRADDQIFLLTIYGKSEKADLSADEFKRIVKLIEELK